MAPGLNQGRFSGIIFSGAILHEDPLNLPANRSKSLSDIRLAQRVLIGIALFVIAAAPSGCIFSPHKDKTGTGPTPPAPYEQLVNPFSVLNSLAAAYGNKDSVEIALIYDINYSGTSFDPDNLNPLTFTRQDEIRHIQALYRSTTITTVSLTFPSVKVRYTDSADPPGWATIALQNMTFDISDTPTSWNLRPSETWEFKFIPHSPDPSSPTDTTWKIVRWQEIP